MLRHKAPYKREASELTLNSPENNTNMAKETTATTPTRDTARQYIQLSVPREPKEMTDLQKQAYVSSVKALLKSNFSIELRAGVVEGESTSEAKTFAVELQAAARTMAIQHEWPGTIRYSTFLTKPQVVQKQDNAFSALKDLFNEEG